MKNSKKAFTLIELLVVVLIIGILAAVAVPQYQKAVDKARASELFAIVKNLKVQQEVFYLANGHYAADCEELGADLPSGFEEDPSETGKYLLTKGSFSLKLLCSNGNNDRAFAQIVNTDDTLHVNIEMFFDHITEQNAAHAGKGFCAATKGDDRSRSVCKSIGTGEPYNGMTGFWL